MNIVNAVAGAAGDMAEEAALRVSPKMWNSGICQCCDDTGGCLDVVCCMPCQISRQCSAIDDQPNVMDCGYMCCALLGMYQGSAGTAFMAVAIRYRMVAKYNIMMEGAIMTALLGIFCFPMSLCQTSRMLMQMGRNPAGTCYQPMLPPNAGHASVLFNPAKMV